MTPEPIELSENPNVLDRTLGNLRRAWRDLTGAARVKLTGSVRPDLPSDDRERLRHQIDACLESRGGEVSARARAADLGRTYLSLNDTGRASFLRLLAYDYGVQGGMLEQAMQAWTDARAAAAAGEAREVGELLMAEQHLREVLTPPRVKLLAQFNALPQGVKFLVDMRADLIPLTRAEPVLKGFDDDFRGLLRSWFDVGFLELRSITWDAPASLLEKLAKYEAVHAIRSWVDIKHRLTSDRRCYAFFHPQMPDEPLIYVWVALVKGISSNVQALLKVRTPSDDPTEADTAIFYSISNAQQGLAGVSFGSFLIKRVVEDLAVDFKRLKTFSTLSPIPGFRTWLDEQLANGDEQLLTQSGLDTVRALRSDDGDVASALARILNDNAWIRNEALQKSLRQPLMRLCASYLTEAKRGLCARDRVAHFHLTNGARLERINWLGDTSSKGLRQSAGMMINYRYRSGEIEANHEAYRTDGEIKLSSSVKNILKK